MVQAMATDSEHPPRQAPRRGAWIPLLMAGLALCAACLRNCRAPAEAGGDALPRAPRTYEFPIFDTVVTLKIWAAPRRADETARAVTALLGDLHRRINLFDPESELAALNRSAADKPFRCSPQLWLLLAECRRAWQATDGAFDVSVGPLMRLWGHHRRRLTLPDEREIAAARDLVGLPRVEFDEANRTVRFPKEGMYLDFGGIAKGYALQLAMDALRERGVSPALVDLGGNVAGCGHPPGRDAFVIGIRNPFAKEELLGTMKVRDRAVATSGNYERQIVIEGRTIQHIVDPRSGQPVSRFAGVTVITPRPIDSDIYSTAVFVAGEEFARKLAERDPNTGIVLVRGSAEAPEVKTYGRAEVEP